MTKQEAGKPVNSHCAQRQSGTKSAGKEILSGFPSGSWMQEAGFDAEIEENGSTFEENALIKARAVHENWDTSATTGLAIDPPAAHRHKCPVCGRASRISGKIARI